MPTAIDSFVSQYESQFAPGYGIVHAGPVRHPTRGPFQGCKVQSWRCGYSKACRSSCPAAGLKVTHLDGSMDFLEADGAEFMYNAHCERNLQVLSKTYLLAPPILICLPITSPTTHPHCPSLCSCSPCNFRKGHREKFVLFSAPLPNLPWDPRRNVHISRKR